MSKHTPENDFLFIGTKGHVIAVDQRDGKTIWETSLPKTGYQVVIMLVENGRILCGTAGRVFALNPADGKILWTNDLPNRGQGVVTLTTLQQSADMGAASSAAQAAQASSAHSGTTM